MNDTVTILTAIKILEEQFGVKVKMSHTFTDKNCKPWYDLTVSGTDAHTAALNNVHRNVSSAQVGELLEQVFEDLQKVTLPVRKVA